MKEVFVIFNPYEKGYYNGECLFKNFLFCKKYFDRESAVFDIEKIKKGVLIIRGKILNFFVMIVG